MVCADVYDVCMVCVSGECIVCEWYMYVLLCLS